MEPIRLLVLHVENDDNRTLSYQRGWPGALAGDARFQCELGNLATRTSRTALRLKLSARRRFDATVVLHSVFSQGSFLGGGLLDAVSDLPGAKVFFVGNEYKLMPEKVQFAERLGVDLLVSQLSSGEAHAVYRERLGCAVIGLPNAGLDESLFAPRTPWRERPVDIGYRAYENPVYLGHRERRELANRVVAAAAPRGLALDVSLDPGDRLGGTDWARFLDRCKAQLGSEAGGDYFELTDATRLVVNAYLAAHRDTTFPELRARFFRDYPDPISGRALSSRVIEAAGTKTVQLLLEGEYGGYFHPWEHYVPIAKDFSNVDEALDVLADDALCLRLTDAAHEVARSELTWERLLDRFHAALLPLL